MFDLAVDVCVCARVRVCDLCVYVLCPWPVSVICACVCDLCVCMWCVYVCVICVCVSVICVCVCDLCVCMWCVYMCLWSACVCLWSVCVHVSVMCVCVCDTYIYVCVCGCVWVCVSVVCVCLYVCMSVFLYVCICMYICMEREREKQNTKIIKNKHNKQTKQFYHFFVEIRDRYHNYIHACAYRQSMGWDCVAAAAFKKKKMLSTGSVCWHLSIYQSHIGYETHPYLLFI